MTGTPILRNNNKVELELDLPLEEGVVMVEGDKEKKTRQPSKSLSVKDKNKMCSILGFLLYMKETGKIDEDEAKRMMEELPLYSTARVQIEFFEQEVFDLKKVELELWKPMVAENKKNKKTKKTKKNDEIKKEEDNNLEKEEEKKQKKQRKPREKKEGEEVKKRGRKVKQQIVQFNEEEDVVVHNNDGVDDLLNDMLGGNGDGDGEREDLDFCENLDLDVELLGEINKHLDTILDEINDEAEEKELVEEEMIKEDVKEVEKKKKERKVKPKEPKEKEEGPKAPTKEKTSKKKKT